MHRSALRDPAPRPILRVGQEARRHERRAGGGVIGIKHQQPVAGEAVAGAGHNPLGGANGLGDVASCDAGMYREVREDLSVAVLAAL